MRRVRRSRLRSTLGLLGCLVPNALAAQRTVSTPASVLGFEPGADRKVPERRQVVAYFTVLARASPRVVVRTLNTTTLGRPFVAAFIGDSATIAGLPGVLADRLVRGEDAEATAIRRTALVILVPSLNPDGVDIVGD